MIYKKAVNSILVADIVFLLIVFCLKLFFGGAAEMPVEELGLPDAFVADQSMRSLGIASKVSSGQRVVDYDVMERETDPPEAVCLYSEEELDILYHIVEAEAEGEDEDGKLLVANVVLNRTKSAEFPDTIREVVYQKVGNNVQFSPVADGRMKTVKVSDSTRHAVARAMEGEDISQGALYFAARKYADPEKMKWFDSELTFLFQHGGHEFFK